MGPLEEILIALPIAAVIVAVVTVTISRRSGKLKCPECGNVFSPPMFDLKRSGLGWTFPYTGVVKCPKCGQTRGRRDYQNAPAEAPATVSST